MTEQEVREVVERLLRQFNAGNRAHPPRERPRAPLPNRRSRAA